MYQECPAVLSQGMKLGVHKLYTHRTPHTLNQDPHRAAEANVGPRQSLVNVVKARRDNVSSKEVMGGREFCLQYCWLTPGCLIGP